MLGKILSIKPVIGFVNGKVSVLCKKRGLKQGMQYLAECVQKDKSDANYGIIASYTYNKVNIDEVIKNTSPKLREQIKIFDNLTPSIACHWGPNAFGYIYVKSEEE